MNILAGTYPWGSTKLTCAALGPRTGSFSMMELLNVDDGLGAPYRLVNQFKQAPSVYLDTCALRGLAQNPQQCERFVRAVRAKKGTLVLNMLSGGGAV
jgi:hypothetical protein